jgi:carboxylesterase type B
MTDNDIPNADEISIPSSVESDKRFELAVIETEDLDATHNDELRSVVETLREEAEKKREKAKASESAQSKKYNQAAAYAYTISANTLEGKINDE